MSIADQNEHKHHFAHHFDSADHEYESSKQGVWLFMVTEVMMFGALLTAYLIFKGLYHTAFHEGSKYLDWHYGTLNTVVLITSSLTMALAIYFIRCNKRQAAIWNLAITLICGSIFMYVKYLEYHHKFELGIYPGKFFNLEGGPHDPHLALYFSFYYLLTGLHGLHVLIGMGLIAWMLIKIIRGNYGDDHWTGVEGVGIFWHLVDLVWIYLFPLLYLIG